MCGLFGFSSYNKEAIKNLSVLTNSLAVQSSVRGTDATGIAFNRNGLQIQKEALSAKVLVFKHDDAVRALVGHTRHATHGSAKQSRNNHPFYGNTTDTKFALTHNGVLWNVESLRLQHNIPESRIETDSYIAVQLIEKQKKLSFETIRNMAESVQGSFSFAILSDRDEIYLVRGDNPLSVLHFPEKQMYVYASTDEILFKAIVDSMLFEDLKKGRFTSIPVEEGTILKINPDGTLEKEKFSYYESYGLAWWEYGFYPNHRNSDADQEYLDILRTMAGYLGIEPEEIDVLLDEGFTPEEVEEYLYEI